MQYSLSNSIVQNSIHKQIYQKDFMHINNLHRSSLSLNSFEDPSLSSHIQTIHTETKNLPRLKYSLTCISNSLAFNDSNRLHNIISISKQNNFRRLINLIVNYQDQKILEESLSILNILLNQGNDLTIQQENQIMHSLSYVNVNNQVEKGFISDKLVQEILYLTYKLKTKNELSQFVATLMSEKMSASQAKKFIKELKKQQLKNIYISDLIKIGFKFKTNVLLMNEILNLIYEKVFSGRDQHQIKKLFQFLPKIVEENIDEQSISYKCLQIYKIIEKSNPNLKIDPLIVKYLQSLLKYKKDLFLPLKREFVQNEESFIKILEFGSQFQIYHLLVIDYLVRNGYRGGKQNWRKALENDTGKKNLKLKEICLRFDKEKQPNLKQSKSLITQSDELGFMSVLPIQTLRYVSSTLQKLLQQPSISNSLHVIKNLCLHKDSQQLLLTIHKISLKQKQFHLVQQIQKLVKESFNQQFVYDQLKNITKVKHKIVLRGQLYFIWLPILLKDQEKLMSLETELIEIMGYDSIQIEEKFYIMQYLLQNKMQKVVTRFLLYLNRQLQAITSIEQQARDNAEALFSQIKFYLKKWIGQFKNNSEIFGVYFSKLVFHLQRTAELLFSKLVEFKSQSVTGLLFELEKWDFYGQNWRQPYRWILTALEEVSQQNPNYTLDCLELFEMCVENISEGDIPVVVKERFLRIVKKNWSRFESEHLFAIERIMQILWQNHQYPILSELKPITPILQLISQQRQFNQKNQYFFQSEHPTSNYLENLQMSNFFGVISQQEFVKYILQLYDKRFSEVKRFTEKNVISLMNFIIWVYQYSEEDMEKGLSDMIMAFLSYKAEGANQISSYNIRKKCIEIVAVVSHSINLLKLPLKELQQTYIGEHRVMHNLNEIIQTIIESKSQFISQLGLQTIVESVMISLITCEDLNLIEEYIEFIESICYIQNSNYALMFQDGMEILYQVLKVEYKIVEKYRHNLVVFVLDILKHYEFVIQTQLLWFLMNKYFAEEDVQISIVASLIDHISKQTELNNKHAPIAYADEKLLVRLIMHHNQNTQLVSMVQQILTKSLKQTVNFITPSDAKPTIKNNLTPQQDFINNFHTNNYSRCQQLLTQIRNPFLQIQKEQLRAFFTTQKLGLYQNLMNFIVNNPATRNEILAIQEFYIRLQCIPQILKLAETMQWNQQNLQKIKVTQFDQTQILFKLEPNLVEESIKSTISKLFSTPGIKKNIIYLLKSMKTTKNQLQILAFYSKCIPQSSNKLLFEVVNDLQIQEGIELMKLHLSKKISNPFEASPEVILYHLYVHVENLLFVNSPQMQNQQRYIKDIAPLLCSHQLQKILPAANFFFIHLSNRLQHKITSKAIFNQLLQVCYQYLSVFQGQGNSGSKNVEIKQPQCLGILSALMFLHKNGDNIHVGLASKIFSSLESKLTSNEAFEKSYEFLLRNKVKIQQSVIDKKPLKSTPSSSLTESIKVKQQKAQNQPVIFAKQPLKQEQQQFDKQQEVNQAFQKGKQLEEYMSVVPRQNKDLVQKNQKEKEQQKAIQSVQMSIELVDQQSLIRPKEFAFEQKNFYQAKGSQSPRRGVSQKQRRQILQNIRLKQTQQISIATLKEHAKFISSLMDYNTLTKEQLEELMKSIDNITSTVNEHHYYVKKLIELEVTFKLINLFKRKDSFIPKDLTYFADMFEAKLLTLHHAMSYKKEKKTIVFDDELTIEFFKLIVKKSLNLKTSRNENTVIIDIVNYCIKSIDAYFKQGLISMFIQLLKIDVNPEDVLRFFCKMDLSKHLIFEIYQRGLLNKFCQVFNLKQNLPTVFILNRWIKLAGKICTTSAIQQKYLEKKIHKLVWEKHNDLMINDVESKKNVAFFFAYAGRKNQKLFQYLVQNQVLQKLLSSLQHQNSEQLYMLFYQIVLENKNALEYCFRIKYHLHLIEKVLKSGQKPKSKYFFKSLGQVMSNKQHQSLFFKEQVVQKLVKEYEIKPEPSIYECLLDFIVTLDNDKEFQELKKQQFWSCLALFEYKLSSQATYAYILQIFLVMIKKGRIKQFNTAEVRGKVTLKAEYSINIEGKQLALRFITALSIRTKECYITERCIRLLSSLVGFKVTSTELDIIEDILDVEGMLQNFEFLTFCHDYEITQNICNRFKNLTQNQLLSTLKILNVLGTETKNNRILRDKLFMPVMEMLKALRQKPLNSQIEQWLLKILLNIVSFRQNSEAAQRLQLGAFLVQFFLKIIQKDPKDRTKVMSQYVTIIEMCRQNNMIPLMELQKILDNMNKSKVDMQVGRISQIKQNLQGDVTNQSNEVLSKMTQGINVKMYKNDGSNSDLILFLTEDRLELNCIVEKGQPIKQKWRIVLSQIHQIISYIDDKQYENSAFHRSGGLFSRPPDRKLCLTAKSKNNEFNILFEKKEDKDSWKKCIEFAIQNSKKILKQFK